MPAELTAALYLRQSHGKQRSIDGQETDNRAACADHTWPVAEVYQDKVSASWFSTAERPDWDRLLADLTSPTRRWNVLVIWESSRGDREPESWLRFLRLCRGHAILIYVYTHERLYDVRVRRDWRTLADEGIDNANASWETSDRVRRDLRQAAQAGRPHATTTYGYERVYDSHTRELLEQREHLQHAANVRDILSRIDAGEPISVIEAALTAHGVPAPRGGDWTRTSIRQVATNLAYIGKRSHHGELHDAIWPPIVDEELFWRVQRRLGDPGRKTSRPGRNRWLLSYLAACGTCGGAMHVQRHGAIYRCLTRQCTSIPREMADTYVSEVVIAWASQRAAGVFAAAADSEAVQARAEEARLRAQLDDAAKASAHGRISLRAFEVMEAELAPLVKAAAKRAREAGTPPAVRSLVGERDVRAAWGGMHVAAQREAVRAIMAVRIRRALHPGRQSAADIRARVAIDWAGETGG